MRRFKDAAPAAQASVADSPTNGEAEDKGLAESSENGARANLDSTELAEVNPSISPIEFRIVDPKGAFNADTRETDFALISHWSVSGHQKIAGCMSELIASATGWPFDPELIPGPSQPEHEGHEPTCCWKGCCAAHGKCHCTVM